MSEVAPRPNAVAAYDAGTLRLAGARLHLRRPEAGDAPRVARFMADYDVVKNLSRAPFPYELKDAEDWLGSIAAAQQPRNAYPFAIVTGEGLIGVVGITVNPQNPASVELGYWLGKPYWGQGFATEAARLAVGFAFNDLALHELEAGHFADNAASGRVLQKLGFAYISVEPRFSKARACEVACRMMSLSRETFVQDGTDQEGARHGG